MIQGTLGSERISRALRDRPVLRGLLLALLAIGVGSLVGAAVALGPVWLAFGALVVAAGGYAVLRSAGIGLAAVWSVITLLPFGTLPFKAGITPTFLELALVALLLVWVLRLLATPEYDLRMGTLGGPLLLFLGLTVFSLLLGARGLPDNLTLHNYVKFVLAVALFWGVVNTLRSAAEQRWAMRLIILGGAAAATLGIVLYLVNDVTSLRLLTALGRLGYPTEGRVLRYIEDDPLRGERAIGTAVDPNSFGGLLALICALTTSQLWAKQPALPRSIIAAASGLMAICIFLTYSRAALLGLLMATVFLALVRERRLWWLLGALGAGGIIAYAGFGLGATFVNRFVEGIQFQDQAQQMRLAEFRNAIEIIKRYPVFGVGFGSGPELGLITGVSSIYLAMAERLGLVGLGAFLLIIATFFVVTLRRMPRLDPERQSWLLGTQAGIVAALAVGLADHYYFNIEFSHMVALFWGVVALGMAVAQSEAQDHVRISAVGDDGVAPRSTEVGHDR